MTQPTSSFFPGVLVTGHFRETQGYAVCRPHGLKSWLMVYTIAGEGIFRQPHFTLEAHPGDLVLLAPNAYHDYRAAAKSWDFYWCHYLPRLTWSTWFHLPPKGQGFYHIALHEERLRERVHALFTRIYTDMQTAEIDQAIDVRTFAEQPLPRPQLVESELTLAGIEMVLLLAMKVANQPQAMDPRIESVLALIATDFASPITVTTLAEQVALSPSRLSHLFKAATGVALIQAILNMRMRQAALLLAHTSASITQIAEQVGYSSPYYFSRMFHQQYGMSPRAYRIAQQKCASL